MAYSNSSTQMINFLLFTFFLLLTTPHFATASPSLIQTACSKGPVDQKLCTEVLGSIPSVRAATNLVDLATSIIDSGLSNATSVHSHIQDLIKAKKGPVEALSHCESGYGGVLVSFRSAGNEIKSKDFNTASYDLYVSGDGFQLCEDAVVSGKIGDETILSGNKFGGVFRISAINVVDTLRHH